VRKTSVPGTRIAPPASRPLERALLFTLLAQGLATVGMALLLLPGGPHAALAAGVPVDPTPRQQGPSMER
jgi:hypothetical protein